jgi:dinuclear metal center YbgI/SA1388 family protein
MAKLNTLAGALDRLLDVASFDDSARNGLQVANRGRVTRVTCAVDATSATFDEAVRRGANLLVVHHGLFWGDAPACLTGMAYRHCAFLLEHDLALYAAHLPLDAHPRYGNNACMARALGLRNRRPFGLYRGHRIGTVGTLPRAVRFDTLRRRVETLLGAPPRCAEFGTPMVRRVAVISGGAGTEAAQAGEAGIDVYLTGEAQLSGYNLAREYGIHAVFGGHYATETFGVRALGEVIRRRFKLPVEFIDIPTPF